MYLVKRDCSNTADLIFFCSRLISERTVEENILKKANQKRMLGDMAIEGGNFTTAFFKEQTIQELFTEPSGLESFANELSKKEKLKEIVTEKSEETKAGGDTVEETPVPSEKNIMAQFEKVGNLSNTMF